jgi:GT2 family glycosyltransferase
MLNRMIGIIILNYNTWDETIECVKSIIQYHDMRDKIIYIVDNNSPNGIEKKQKDFFLDKKNINLIFNKENKGYSAGNNIGLSKAIEDGCDYFLICNSDIVFKDNTIDILRDSINVLPNDVSIVGPRIYNIEDKFQKFMFVIKLTYSVKIKLILSHTPLKIFLKKFLADFYYSNEYFESPKEVFCVMGCCFMISTVGIKCLYPLDENTFLYDEEFIIGCVNELNKLKTYIIPNTKVIHAHGVSTSKSSNKTNIYMIESEQYYLKKYLNTNYFARKFLYFLRLLSKKFS